MARYNRIENDWDYISLLSPIVINKMRYSFSDPLCRQLLKTTFLTLPKHLNYVNGKLRQCFRVCHRITFSPSLMMWFNVSHMQSRLNCISFFYKLKRQPSKFCKKLGSTTKHLRTKFQAIAYQQFLPIKENVAQRAPSPLATWCVHTYTCLRGPKYKF